MTGNNGHVLGLLVLGAILIGVLGCGDDDPAGATPTNDIDNQLVFTRPDSSEIAMGTQYAICCGIWEAGLIDKNTLKIFLFGASQQESSPHGLLRVTNWLSEPRQLWSAPTANSGRPSGTRSTTFVDTGDTSCCR